MLWLVCRPIAIAACVCAALLAVKSIAAAEIGNDIQERVQRLGTAEGRNDLTDAEVLAKTPYESVGALIGELHTIPHPENAKLIQNTAEVQHLISVIAALRYITGGRDFYLSGGEDFCSTTNWKFGDSAEEANRHYWLYFQSSKCVTFFAVWPSRYRIYLAPMDAQQHIISQWRHWYAAQGKAYEFKPIPNSQADNLLLWQCARDVYSPPDLRRPETPKQ